MKEYKYSSLPVLACMGSSIGSLYKRIQHNYRSRILIFFLLFTIFNKLSSQSPGVADLLSHTQTMEVDIETQESPCNDFDQDGICDHNDDCPDDHLNVCNLPVPCIPSSSNNSFEFIQKVQFNTIENQSGDNGGYGDFTSLNTAVHNGMTYDIKLIPGYTGDAYNEVWRVRIDFNKDGDFEDDSETVVSASGTGAISTYIAIPEDVTTNGTTRMRVSMQYNTAASPCQNVSFGEVEDYFVIITKACSAGQSCDDGNQCTTNDVLDDECNCTGTQVGDSDKDGICDAIDECPELNDALIGQPCDDGDLRTIYDSYREDCRCAGEYIDRDVSILEKEAIIKEDNKQVSTEEIKLENDTDVSLEEIKEGVKIYPNPALYFLNVKIDEKIQSVGDITIHISDMTGKIISHYSNKELKHLNYKLDLSSFQDGLVMMSTVLEDRIISTQKIIILKK